MTIQNSDLIDPEQSVYSVLGLVAFRLTGPYWWHCKDIDDEMAKGSVFRAYEPEDAERGGLDVASITVVDVTNDTTEPDVSALAQSDIPPLDDVLQEGIQAQLVVRGMELIRWMSSYLNQVGNLKGLVTAYIVKDHGKERQYFALRIKIKGRKVVAVGVFDIAKKDVLAVPIFNILRNMALLA